jgi:hypothetical protein
MLDREIDSGHYGFLPLFLRALGDRCNQAESLSVSEALAGWCNDAIKWTLETVKAGAATPVMLQYAGEFLRAAMDHRDDLSRVGLDEDLLRRFGAVAETGGLGGGNSS